MITRERVFEAWVTWMLAHRWAWLAGVLVTTVVMTAYTVQLPIITTLRDLLPSATPGIALYDEARRRFGGDEATYLAIEADDHFTKGGLARLAALTASIADHPFVERVISPTNAQQMWVDEEGTLVIDDFVRDGRTPGQIRASMLNDESFEGALVSRDGRFVLVVAQAVPSTADAASLPKVWQEVVRRLASRAVASAKESDPGKRRRLLELSKQTLGAEIVQMAVALGYPAPRVHAVGFTPLLSMLLVDANRNLTWLLPLTICAIIAMLGFLLRRPVYTILPILCVGPAVVWALATGGFLFGRITLIATAAPVIVLVVGVSDVVHLITQYRHELARGMDQEAAIRASFVNVGAACVLTSVTTLVGFGAMVFLPLPTAQELGATAGIGVVAAFILSFILTPIFLSFTPVTDEDRSPTGARDGLSRVLEWTVAVIVPRPATVTAIGLAITAATFAAVLQYRVENSLTRKLQADHPMRRSVQTVESKLGASSELEILFDTGEPQGLANPAVIEAMAELRRRVEARPLVDDTLSVLDPLERMHALMAPELAAQHPVPTDSRALIAQYLFLFEVSGGRDLESLVDRTRQYGRMVLRGRDGTAEALIAESAQYDRWADELLPPGAEASMNGIGLLAARLGPPIFDATVQGLMTAMGLIAVMIAALFRSIRVGILSLIPNLFPVAFGVLCIPLLFEQIDVDTLTFMPVCVGVAVDDTIHFLTRLSIERRKGLSRPDAVAATIREAGHGILRTSVVLVGGFSWLLLADYQPIATIGLLLPAVLVAAVVMDLTLAPAMAQLGWIDVKGAPDADR